MLRIGLTQRLDIVPGRQERRESLDQEWARLLLALHWLPIPLCSLTPNPRQLVTELKLDGVILTGGNDLTTVQRPVNAALERDQFETALIEACSAQKIPLLGVCRGMQLLAAHYGAKISPVENHVKTEHSISAKENTPLPLPKKRFVNSFHRYAIPAATLPPCFDLAAVSEDGGAEALAHRESPQWGIMWHPERGPRNPEDLRIFRALFEPGSNSP